MLAVGSLVAFSLDATFDAIGYKVLTYPALENVFSSLLDVPFVAFTKFNNTITAGSLVFGILVYIPLFIIFILLLNLWRKILAPVISNSKIVKAIYKIPLLNRIAAAIAEC